MRLRPRSIRVRDTLIATLVSLLAFGLPAAGIDLLIREGAEEHHYRDIEYAARREAIDLRTPPPPRNPIPPDPNGVDLIQVVDSTGRVIYATRRAGQIPITSERPPQGQLFRNFVHCRTGRSCLFVHVTRVSQTEIRPTGTVYVYAAKEVPTMLAPGVLELMILTVVLALAGLSSWITWRVVGRTLGPIDAIRRQLAEITASDLSRRVPEPGSEDEIANLARTANATLDRLERSVNRQRQFTADASHELRTPVAGLRANLEDALMHPGDADLEGTLEAALRDTERLEAIITDLLLLARLGTSAGGTQEKIDLAGLATDQARGRRTEIHRNLVPGVTVVGVSMQLSRLLGNLLDNAEAHAESRIDIEVRREGDDAVVTVTDDGPGIAPKEREQVFRRFTRLDTARSRQAGGTGLGLAIARDIARAHGGTLTVEDSPKGARFMLRLPLGG
ncbi:sensor histidine kinase [Actinomadura sp. HBU206391]|uniref:sensor histidine kinase n=1 Tax=Actinomadura sp. HBU206391 TaxID=2731692 RepID=UPI00164EFAF5|nr:ATP-binding protein [Actinomadura sp. HBU206391]MBC6460961.1 HAMP domain-containing protein [Actinomadura sp. HBU206391]